LRTDAGGAPPAFVRSASLRCSHPLAGALPFLQSLTNLAAADADIVQIPVAKTAQRDKVRLTLAMSDKGGNPTELRRAQPNISLAWIANALPWKREADREHYLEAFRRAGLD
jgi:hypothetical protein